MPTSPSNFDRIARPYRWLEYLSFGPMLERCRFYRIPQLTAARRALVLGDGDGRFLARLLTCNPEVQVDAVDRARRCCACSSRGFRLLEPATVFELANPMCWISSPSGRMTW